MNNTATKRVTLTQATALPREEWNGNADGPGLRMTDLDITPAELQHLLRVWLWLHDVHPDSEGAVDLRKDLWGGEMSNGDASLLIALSLPATEFLDWFSAEPWDCFTLTERIGSDAWAWGVLDRASATAEGMGQLALQQPLAPPATWPTPVTVTC